MTLNDEKEINRWACTAKTKVPKTWVSLDGSIMLSNFPSLKKTLKIYYWNLLKWINSNIIFFKKNIKVCPVNAEKESEHSRHKPWCHPQCTPFYISLCAFTYRNSGSCAETILIQKTQLWTKQFILSHFWHENEKNVF